MGGREDCRRGIMSTELWEGEDCRRGIMGGREDWRRGDPIEQMESGKRAKGREGEL